MKRGGDRTDSGAGSRQGGSGTTQVIVSGYRWVPRAGCATVGGSRAGPYGHDVAPLDQNRLSLTDLATKPGGSQEIPGIPPVQGHGHFLPAPIGAGGGKGAHRSCYVEVGTDRDRDCFGPFRDGSRRREVNGHRSLLLERWPLCVRERTVP